MLLARLASHVSPPLSLLRSCSPHTCPRQAAGFPDLGPRDISFCAEALPLGQATGAEGSARPVTWKSRAGIQILAGCIHFQDGDQTSKSQSKAGHRCSFRKP